MGGPGAVSGFSFFDSGPVILRWDRGSQLHVLLNGLRPKKVLAMTPVLSFYAVDGVGVIFGVM